MGIEAISPWVSLLAGVLSIGYIVVEEYRTRGDGGSGDQSGDRGSLTGALRKHDGFVITAVTMFSLAGLAHVLFASSVSPVVIWGVPGFVVVVTGIAEATGRTPDAEAD